jgi:hypothetical protein
MAKNRCPACGAAHKGPTATCRLCGYVMDGSVETPTSVGGARVEAPAKRGVGSLAIIGVIIVAALAIGALALHVVNGGDSVNKVVAKIGVKGTTNGWKTVTDTTGGYTVSLPPNAAPTSVPFTLADNGQLTGWLATIGDSSTVDTEIYVISGKIHALAGETPEDTVARMADAKLATDGGYVISRNTTTYQGYPAVQYTINRITFQGQNGFENATLFVRNSSLYVVETLSIYQGSPATEAYNSTLDSLHFTS